MTQPLDKTKAWHADFRGQHYLFNPVPREEWYRIKENTVLLAWVQEEPPHDEPFPCILVENKIFHPTETGLGIVFNKGEKTLTLTAEGLVHVCAGVILASHN